MYGSFYTVNAKVVHFNSKQENEDISIKVLNFQNAQHLAENYSECADTYNRESAVVDQLTGEVLVQYRDGECIYLDDSIGDRGAF